MKNEYEVRGDVTAIILRSPKYGTMETLITTNRLERAQEFGGIWCLYYSPDTKTFYVQGSSPMVNYERKTVKLHRWITNAPKGMKVDHRNHDTLNNTDDNLRICTHKENAQNRKIANTSNKSSGIRGVSWHKQEKKWRAVVRVNGKQIHLGCYVDIEDAEHASKEGRAKYMPFSDEAAV